MAMKAEVKGKQLVITIDLEEPRLSPSGKSMVIASSHGNQMTEAKVDGKPITVGLNAYYKA